jgi:hypothetical protein
VGFITVEVYPDGPVHEKVEPANVDVVIDPVQAPQAAGEGVNETTGTGFTVIVANVEVEHPPFVPVIVYVVVVVGLRTTVEDVIPPGVQVYVVAPVAVIVVVIPAQIVCEFTVTTGFGITVTVDVAVEVQPFTSVTIIVYVVVETGLAIAEGELTLAKPVAGDHKYI